MSQMADLTLTATGVAGWATLSLGELWTELAKHVAEANKFAADAESNPELLGDSRVVASIRWASVFKKELAAVQKVYRAVAIGASVPTEQIHEAEELANRLLEIHARLLNQVNGNSGTHTSNTG
jgi:hypothetical protein